MNNPSPEILICGAGIAGIATAYHLAVQHNMTGIWLVDERPPLTLTSDKSTEAYRNWWPGPDDAMVQLMNRSIDWMETLAAETGNVFHLNRRGYLFATANPAQIENWLQAGRQAEAYGAGELRIHDGTRATTYQAHNEGNTTLPGADLIIDPDLLRTQFPWLTPDAVAALHVRRAGWLSAQQFGMAMLEAALAHGVTLVRDRVSAIQVDSGNVASVTLAEGGQIPMKTFINAAGPHLKAVGEMFGVDLPVFSERHLKVSIADTRRAVPRNIPMAIWSDKQHLAWADDEREFLAEDEEMRWMLDEFPSGAHTRPDGGEDSDIVILLWEYHTPVVPPTFPLELDEMYPEIALRGMARMVPALKAYDNQLPKPYLDGGYYTKTKENRPFACPLPVGGAYVIGAMSGFGIMSAMGLGELLAAHITGEKLPPYALAFDLRRYDDPAYQERLANWRDTWQL